MYIVPREVGEFFIYIMKSYYLPGRIATIKLLLRRSVHRSFHYWANASQFTQSTSENKQSLFETCGHSPEGSHSCAISILFNNFETAFRHLAPSATIADYNWARIHL